MKKQFQFLFKEVPLPLFIENVIIWVFLVLILYFSLVFIIPLILFTLFGTSNIGLGVILLGVITLFLAVFLAFTIATLYVIRRSRRKRRK